VLEYSVAVGGLLGNLLDDVPVFDDLAVLEPEDVDDGAATRVFLAHAVDVEDHVVAVGEGALDLAARVREFLAQEADEGLEAFDAVRRRRVVLDVTRPEKFCRRIIWRRPRTIARMAP
jgi:hypothetical protein